MELKKLELHASNLVLVCTFLILAELVIKIYCRMMPFSEIVDRYPYNVAGVFLSFAAFLIWCVYERMTKLVNVVHENKYCSYGNMRKSQRTRNAKNWPSPYPNSWYALAESEEVKKGHVIYVPAIGQNFAVFRTENDEIKVVDAYCPHLGANMAIGGKVKGDCIECPFHGWHFDGNTGACLKTHSTHKAPPEAKVEVWHSQEINGLIFVWYHAEQMPPLWAVPKVDEIHDGKYSCFGMETNYVNTHIQDIGENLSDSSHFQGVHGPSILIGSNLGKSDSKWANKIIQHVWRSKWEINNPPVAHTTSGYVYHELRLFGVQVRNVYTEINQFGPSFVSVQSPSVSVLITVTPVEPLVQKVVTKAYTKRKSIWGFLFFHFLSTMLARNILIWNNKTYRMDPNYARDEKPLKEYRRWMSQFYCENSIPYHKAVEGLDW